MNLHFFEFNDHPAVPGFIRKTLFEVLTYCNGQFRPYYQQVAEDVLKYSESNGNQNIVELGAGLAPITRALLNSCGDKPIHFTPCDLFPAADGWKELEAASPRVKPIYTPVDFSQKRTWEPKTMLVIVAALHHIPHSERAKILKTLIGSADSVLVHEPISNSPISIALSLFAWIPSWLTPAAMIRKPGSFRRILWCWLVPVIPVLFTWDGFISCLRQWTTKQWKEFASQLGDGIDTEMTFTKHGYRIHFQHSRD